PTDADGAFVARFGRVEHGADGVLLTSAPLARNPRAGGDDFEPAVLPVEVERAVGVDEDVAYLSGGAPRTAPEFATQHEARGEARAEVEVGDRFGSGPPEQVEGAECCRVDVVL